MHPHQLDTVARVREFALAGNATLTLVSRKTGNRFTFKIRQPEPDKPHFISLLNGPSNETDFVYVGMLRPFDGEFVLTRGSKLVHDAPSVQAFRWFWRAIRANVLPEQLEVWHEGRCGRCGRKLTVPESIADGFGPECVKRRGKAERSQADLRLI